MNEIKLMCSLSHPCTVRLYAWTETPMAMVMEIAVCDLRQYYSGKSNAFDPFSYVTGLEILLDASRGLLVSSQQAFAAWATCFNRLTFCENLSIFTLLVLFIGT